MPAAKQDISKSRTSSRKYLYLALVVLLAFAGWSAFWFFSYTKTQGLVDRLLARQIGGKPVVTCQDQQLGGYPFRLYLSCSSYKLANPRTGWQIEGGPLRAIWQVYAPNLAVIETEDRLKIDHAASGQTFDIVSDLMRGSVRFSPTDFVARASFEANMPTISSQNSSIAEAIGDITAEKLVFHARPTPQKTNDLDLSIAATELSAGQWPIVSGQLSLTALEGLAQAIRTDANPARAWLQHSGKIENIDGLIEIGQKTLKLNGAVSFDDQGKANGLVKLSILNPGLSQAGAAKPLSAKRDGLNGPLTALQLMGKPVKDGTMIGSQVDIKLSAGQITAGFLPLGNVPALR